MPTFPEWTGTTSMKMDGQGNYNSLQLTVKQRSWKGLSYTASYTYSHSIDSAPGEWNQVQNYFNLNGSRSNSSWDQPQTFTFNAMHLLPFGPGQPFGSGLTGVAEKVAEGWQINGIYSALSGIPFTPRNATNVSNADVGQRPDRFCSGTLSNPTINRWFNPGCFTSPALYHFGDSGRDILFGPGTNELDFSVFKRTYISSENGPCLEFRAESFKIFDRSQFNNPAATIDTPSAGTISSAGDPAGFIRTSREIQFALKFYF